jgi:hypothetical protein
MLQVSSLVLMTNKVPVAGGWVPSEQDLLGYPFSKASLQNSPSFLFFFSVAKVWLPSRM